MYKRSISISVPLSSEFGSILTEEAMDFIEVLNYIFEPMRSRLLQEREIRQEQFLKGQVPNFLDETKLIRKRDWKITSIPPDLVDRRVEITGPASNAKMVINALNSGANVYMADAEDSESPTWKNLLVGQVNLHHAVRNKLVYTSPEGKAYALNEKRAVLMMRPRGLHLLEKHFLVDECPVSGSLFDFGLFVFHNAQALLASGTGPYFYLPKMESHLEARWWERVFNFTEGYLELPHGTIKATVLIETLPAAFEMDEILYELKDHVVGLNCGRWDYIFSFIKKLGANPKFIFPDRSNLVMTQPFLEAYAKQLIYTCHRRGAHAMGGMAAQIPIKNDPEANERALEKVRADKQLEVARGHDGTWVAHPGLVPLAQEIFKAIGPNQLSVVVDPKITSADLLAVPSGSITLDGWRTNIRVALQYLESWLRGQGCVPINNLMEDAATAEISRMQIWQWRKHQVASIEAVAGMMFNEFYKLNNALGAEAAKKSKYQQAFDLLFKTTQDPPPDFLTISAYEQFVKKEDNDV